MRSRKTIRRQLAGDWLELEDDQGRIYYANAVTRQTSWVRPDAAAQDARSLEQQKPAQAAASYVVSAEYSHKAQSGVQPDCAVTGNSRGAGERSSSAPPRVLEQRKSYLRVANTQVASSSYDWDAGPRTQSAAGSFSAAAHPAAGPETATSIASVKDLQRNLQSHTSAGVPPGIGLVVAPDPDPQGYFVVENVVEDSIAASTGRLHVGDIIEAVDGVSVKGCSSIQLREWVVSQMRKGVVTLTVRKAARDLHWKRDDVLQVDLFAGAQMEKTPPQVEQSARRLAFQELPIDNLDARDTYTYRGGKREDEYAPREQVLAVTAGGAHKCGGEEGSAALVQERWKQHEHQSWEKDSGEMRQKLSAAEDACQMLSRVNRQLEDQVREAGEVAEREKQRSRSLEQLCDDKDKALRQVLQDVSQQQAQDNSLFLERQRELLGNIAEMEERERTLKLSMEQACAALERKHEDEKREWHEKRDQERGEEKLLSNSLKRQLEEEREAQFRSQAAYAQERMAWQTTLHSLQARLGQVVEISEVERSKKEEACKLQLQQERQEELERQRAKSAIALQETLNSEREQHMEVMQKVEQLRADDMQKHKQALARADAEKHVLQEALDRADAEKDALRQYVDHLRHDLQEYTQLVGEYRQLQREHAQLQQHHSHLQNENDGPKAINHSRSLSPEPFDMAGGGGRAWQKLIAPEGKIYYFQAATNRTQWTPPPEGDASTSSDVLQISAPQEIRAPQVQLSKRKDGGNGFLVLPPVIYKENAYQNDKEVKKDSGGNDVAAGDGWSGTGEEGIGSKKFFKWNSPLEQIKIIYSPTPSQSPQSGMSVSPVPMSASTIVFRASPNKGKGNEERQAQEEAEDEADGNASEIQQWLRILRKSGGGEPSSEAIEQAARSLGLRSVETDGRREIQEEVGAVEMLVETVSAVDTPSCVRKHCCMVLANVTLDRQGRQPLLDLPLPFMDVLLHLIQSMDDDIAKHSALCLSNLVMDPEGKSAESFCDKQVRGKERGTESVYVPVNHKGQCVSHDDAIESGRTLFSASYNSLNVLARCFVAAHTVRAEQISSTSAPVPETTSSVSMPRMRYLAGALRYVLSLPHAAKSLQPELFCTLENVLQMSSICPDATIARHCAVALKSLQNAIASQEDGRRRKGGEDEISKENAPPMVSQAANWSTELKAPDMDVTRPTNKTGSASVSVSQRGMEAGDSTATPEPHRWPQMVQLQDEVKKKLQQNLIALQQKTIIGLHAL